MIKNVKVIDGIIYLNLIIFGVNNLINNKNRIDVFNVFFVFDGDIGINMFNIVEVVVKVFKSLENISNFVEVFVVVFKNMLFGVCGNFGVILS